MQAGLEFDHKHYVPILRWKGAERRAIARLAPMDSQHLTPLVELIPKAFATAQRGTSSSAQAAAQVAESILQYWGAAPVLVDAWLLDNGQQSDYAGHILESVASEGRRRQLAMIPVIGLNAHPGYQSAVTRIARQDVLGACVRLFRSDLATPDLGAKLTTLLSRLSLHPEDADLVVDFQVTDGTEPTLAAVCSTIPLVRRWRTFTVASGSFPWDLAGLAKNRQHQLPRLDWLWWHNQVISQDPLPRLPAFSDYAIQHPIYHELAVLPNFSGSIRYTHAEYWVIMRGEGVRNPGGPGYAQWPANAQLLCGRPEFCGPDYSSGDRYIYEMAQQLAETGNAATWLQAGLNHHLTFVVRQIASLHGAEAAAAP